MKRSFRIEATGDAREVYRIDAETEEEAREAFETGRIGPPELTEVSSTIYSIEDEGPAAG